MSSTDKKDRFFPKSASPAELSDPVRARAPSGQELLVTVVHDDGEEEKTEKWASSFEASDTEKVGEDDVILARRLYDERSGDAPDSHTKLPGTERHASLTLSRAEVRVLKDAFSRALKKDPFLSVYFIKLMHDAGVSVSRVSDLVKILGLAEKG
jgi:hypothetical protein